MKNVRRFILIIFLLIPMFNNSIFADEKTPDGFMHPGGLEGVKFNSGNADQNERPIDPGKFWVTKDNLKNFSDIEQWMEEAGLAFNDDNLGEKNFVCPVFLGQNYAFFAFLNGVWEKSRKWSIINNDDYQRL